MKGKKKKQRTKKKVTQQDLDKIKRIFDLFFKNSNDPERLEDSVDLRLNNFLDEYILDILEIYRKETTESSEGDLRFDYEKIYDLDEYKSFKNKRKNILAKYKAGLLKKGILNQKNMFTDVLRAAMKLKKKLKKIRERKAAEKKEEEEKKKNGLANQMKMNIENNNKEENGNPFKEDEKDEGDKFAKGGETKLNGPLEGDEKKAPKSNGIFKEDEA